jgi:uncharacterized protein (TIGR02646 family)
MKPVEKGAAPQRYSSYKHAKPALIACLGPHCSYCEAYGAPASLDVEHIYPKDPHPSHEHRWENFLIACTSCNSKKHAHLGSGRQRGLLKRFLWPHLDNTCRAFTYLRDGRIEPAAGLSPSQRTLAEKTIAMTGFMVNPAVASDYNALAIAYSGADLREQLWQEAELTRADYLADPTAARAQFFALSAAKRGYFSVWMEVFHDRPEVRRELIAAFKADPQCFDGTTQAVRKGRV